MTDTSMKESEWNAPIYRHRGAFIHQDELEEHSHVFRLLSGAEKFEDEDGWDGDSDPLGLINSQYGDEIEAIRQQCDEKQMQTKHIKDLTEKVTKSITEEQWVANFNLPKPWRFPRLSSWSKAQQRFIVDMTARYWATGIPANPHPSEERNVMRLMGYITDMRAEQEEYIKFARKVNASQLACYNFIRPELDQYIQLSMKNKIEHIKSAYPADYHQLRMLPLAPPASHPPCFFPVSAPLELGQVPVCVIPNMMKYTDVKRQTHFLKMFFPTDNVYPRQRDGGFKTRDGTYLYKMPVSADPNVARLSAQQEFDLVTSPSALKTIVDNSAPWDRQWEVPVTVRLVPGTRPGQHRKVAFLDKPLPPRSLTCVERNQRAHKRTARLLVCKRPSGPGPVDYSVWEHQPDRRKTEQFKEKLSQKKKTRAKQRQKQLARKQAEEEEDPETGRGMKRTREDSSDSGEESEPDSRPDTPNTSAAPPESEDGDSDGAGLQIDCEDGEGSEEGGRTEEDAARTEDGRGKAAVGGHCGVKSSPAVANTALSHTRGSIPVSISGTNATPGKTEGKGPDSFSDVGDCAVKSPGTALSGTTEPVGTDSASVKAAAGSGSPQQEDGGYLHPPPGLSVHYRVWRLGELRILLRAATHAMRETPNAGLVRYTVHAKPAYQPSVGIEVMTRPELVSQWLDCLLRPGSRLLRVHLDPASQQVITPEERTLSQLTEEFAKYDTGFRPPYGLQVLESVLSALTSLAPGQYLLSHDSRAGAFARLCRAGASSDPGDVSVHLSFPPAPARVALESPRCLAIDPSILTPFNTRYGRVPATFKYRNPELPGWKEYWEEKKKEGITRKKKKRRKKDPPGEGPGEPGRREFREGKKRNGVTRKKKNKEEKDPPAEDP